jgi:potassium-transporting ATPase ATP-binding subunit
VPVLALAGALAAKETVPASAGTFRTDQPMFATYPQLNALNIMKLHSPQSAVLSAVIFNALIIVALIPLALRGVKFRPSGAAAILRRNVFIYGVGGIILPFIFIKLIDLILTATGAY